MLAQLAHELRLMLDRNLVLHVIEGQPPFYRSMRGEPRIIVQEHDPEGGSGGYRFRIRFEGTTDRRQQIAQQSFNLLRAVRPWRLRLTEDGRSLAELEPEGATIHRTT